MLNVQQLPQSDDTPDGPQARNMKINKTATVKVDMVVLFLLQVKIKKGAHDTYFFFYVILY